MFSLPCCNCGCYRSVLASHRKFALRESEHLLTHPQTLVGGLPGLPQGPIEGPLRAPECMSARVSGERSR